MVHINNYRLLRSTVITLENTIINIIPVDYLNNNILVYDKIKTFYFILFYQAKK